MIRKMRKFTYLLFLSFLFTILSCKKDTVDATNPIAFRTSVNEMAGQLNTFEQVKFNEALYILKTFGSDEESYVKQMSILRQILAGKKTEEIFTMADKVAQKEGIEWSSKGIPSLGEMNIFEETSAKEVNPNEIIADDELAIEIKPTSFDTIVGAKALRIIPRLMKNGNRLYFKDATLPIYLEVYSGGKRLLKNKNLIQNSDFKGFYLPFKILPKNQIEDGKIDIQISIKASNKTYKSTQFGIRVNEKAFDKTTNLKTVSYGEFPEDNSKAASQNDSLNLNKPSQPTRETPKEGTTTLLREEKPKIEPKEEKQKEDNQVAKGSAKATVQSFLSNLSAKKLRKAYKASKNPNWGSYDNFSNTHSGFGNLKTLYIKSIKTNNADNKTASVDATYDVEDTSGNKSALNVCFGLKNINGNWKITSYTIK